METIISLKNVSKVYQVDNKEPGIRGALKSIFKPNKSEFRAVDNISLDIKKGEIIGFIGSNGAGKSTTIKMMTGILVPSSGEIVTNERVPYENRIANAYDIGVVFGQRSQLVWDIAFEESLELQKDIYGLSRELYTQRRDYIVKKLKLQELLRKPIRQMSLGQKMRCELATAFLHKPKIVYLDEPTIGLDVEIKHLIHDFLREIVAKDQTTVILTTHDMQDIERLATRIIMIDSGKIIYEGTIDQLHKHYGNKKLIRVQTIDPEIQIKSDKIANAVTITRDGAADLIEFSIDDITLDAVVSEIIQHNQVTDIEINNESIESIVKSIYIFGLKDA